MGRWQVAAVAAVVTVGGVAVARDENDAPVASEPVRAAASTPRAGCAEQVRQPIGPADEGDLVVGPVIVRGVLRHANDDHAEYRKRHDRDPPVKAGVVVEPGTGVVISIDRRDRRKASLVYRPQTRAADRVAEGDRSIRFDSCFDDAPTGWPGGFLLAGPRCVRLIVAVEGQPKPARRRLAFGRGTC